MPSYLHHWVAKQKTHNELDYNRLYDVLSQLPKYDYPPNSRRFYAVKSKHIGNYASLPQKMRKLQNMIERSQEQLDTFIHTIDKDERFTLVNDLKHVAHSKVFIKSNVKSHISVLEKLQRPDILMSNPKYKLEHMRDTFRFKIVVQDLDDAVLMIHLMNQHLFEGGLTTKNVFKMDIFKLVMPKMWGWRFIAFDFCFDSGLIVECYITLRDMDMQKKAENHKIFEKWRNRNFSKLSVGTQKRYRRDVRKSFNKYYKTFIDMIDVNQVSRANNLLLKLMINNFNDYTEQLKASKKMLLYV